MIDPCCGALLGVAGAVWIGLRGDSAARRGRGSATGRAAGGPSGSVTGRGIALRGTLWAGGLDRPFDDGVVIIGVDGRIAAAGPSAEVSVPADLLTLGGAGHWIGPALMDAHVHLAFADGADPLAGGLAEVRDLGSPRGMARALRAGNRPCAAAGPVVTAAGGYPSTSWGVDGFSAFADSPAAARALAADLAAEGTTVIKVALEPAEGRPVPPARVLTALVDAAHAAGVPVVAHALTPDTVRRAVDSGVDELAHVPAAQLGEPLIDLIAAAGVPVVSTLQTFQHGGASSGSGQHAVHNAALLYAAGVPLIYGTDLGNAGTRPGVDPRELDRLAATGMGRLGALRAATGVTASAAGARTTPITIGRGGIAELVLLPADPLREPAAWRAPSAVVSGTELLLPNLDVRECVDN